MTKIIAPLRQDTSGDDIANLHLALEALNQIIDPKEKQDKLFGPSTKRAVASLQKRYELPETGEVDQATAALINLILEHQSLEQTPLLSSSSVSFPTLKKDLLDPRIGALQKYLSLYKYYIFKENVGITDRRGIFGPDTEATLAQAFKEEPPVNVKLGFFNRIKEWFESVLKNLFNDKKYIIIGRIINKRLKGVPDLKVEAWDKDWIGKDDPLGGTTTDSSGWFHIEFSSKQSRDWIFDRKPDLYFRIFQGDELIDDTEKRVMCNIFEQELELVIQVDVELPFPDPPPPTEGDDPPPPDPVIEHEHFGQLINQKTDTPVVGFLIKGFDPDRLDEEEQPFFLSQSFSDHQGMFSIPYSIPITKEGEDPLKEKALKLFVFQSDGEKVHEENIKTKVASTDIVKTVFKVPEQQQPSPLITSVAQEANLKIPADLSKYLKAENINSLADIRTNGGLATLLSKEKTPPIDPNDKIVLALDGQANLRLISEDITANQAMIDKGYDSSYALASNKRTTFVSAAQPALGDFGAAQLQVISRAQTKMASHIYTGLAANIANGFKTGLDIAGTLVAKEQECGCEDCESAVSPLAYLADLMEYCVTHIDDNGNPIDFNYLIENFHQPFSTLPASCEQMDRRVRQVRICIEVLRSYLDENPPIPAKQQQLHQDLKSYLVATYTLILDKLGTSFEELRLSRTAEKDKRKELAVRLGILLAGGGPDHLNELLLDPTQGELSEAKLEELFGCKSTTTDSLTDVGESKLRKWKLEYLRDLWQSQDHPEDPFTSGQIPLVEPDIIDDGNLRTPQAGESAFDLWQSRRQWVDDKLADLQTKREANNLEFILKKVLGDPLPDLNSLLQSLNSGIDLDNTVQEIEGLNFTVESYRRLMEIKEKHDVSIGDVTNEEWTEIYAILTQILKKGSYGAWTAEEAADNITFSPEMFIGSLNQPPSTKWLTDNTAQQTWMRILEYRGHSSIIDPDLLNADDLKVPEAGNAAFDIWQQRRVWIEGDGTPGNPGKIGELKQLREDTSASDDDPTALEELLKATLKIDFADLNNILAEQENGTDIHNRLRQLNIERDAFNYILGIKKILEGGSAILDSEWEAVYAILVQVLKRRLAGTWQDAEKSEGIVLSQDHFKLPEAQPLEFPPRELTPLPEWRATNQALWNWRDTLQTRIEQENTVIQSLDELISSTEEVTLPMLRDALVNASNAGGITQDEKAKALTDRLLIDCLADGCQQTTRIAQAIETLLSLLFSLRTRQLNDTSPFEGLDLDSDFFDEEWQWIGSYATWRSAMFTFIYPENILIPSLRRWQSPAFRELVKTTRRNRRLNSEQACKAVRQYTDYFRDVALLKIDSSCQTQTRLKEEECRSHSDTGRRCLFYLFARGGHTNKAYFSVYDPEDNTGYAQSFWKPIPGLGDINDIIGTSVYQIETEERFIFLFGRRNNSGAQELIFTKYDLEQRNWDEEPSGPLELPDETLSFTAVVKQSSIESQPPHLAIRTPNGAVYMRKLNREGSDWADTDNEDDETSDWLPNISRMLGRRYNQLCAMVEVSSGTFNLVMRRSSGSLHYRQFGSMDDGTWRYCGYGDCKGAFSWPGISIMYVFDRHNYRRISSHILGDNTTVWTIPYFDFLLESRTGASFKQWIISDGTRYAGLTLYDFFTMELEENPYRINTGIFQALFDLIIDIQYRGRVNVYFDYIEKQIEDDEGWREWKIANKLIRQISGRSIVSVLRRIFNNENSVGFKSRLSGESRFLGSSPISGLQNIAPSTGYVGGKGAGARKQLAFRKSRSNMGVYRTTFTKSDDSLTPKEEVRIAPRVTGPFDIKQLYTETQLQWRKTAIQNVYQANESGPASNLEYIKEAYYFVPVYIALQMQKRAYFTEALDWYRNVYDYSMLPDQRKIYYGLVREESLENAYDRAEDWLLDPLNPHEIARARIKTYTRFTVLSIIRCFLEFGDQEFTRDNAESVPRARVLYMTALELLEAEDLKLQLGLCTDLVGSIDITVGDDKWVKVWNRIRTRIAQLNRPQLVQELKPKLEAIWQGNDTIGARFKSIREEVEKVIISTPPRPLGEVIQSKNDRISQIHVNLQSQPVFSNAVKNSGVIMSESFANGVSMVTGLTKEALADKATGLPFMRERITYGNSTAIGSFVESNVASDKLIREDYRLAVTYNPVAPSYTAELGRFAVANTAAAVKEVLSWTWQYVPAPSVEFCIPTNPIIEALQLRAELNLYKIRTCRNISGVERELEPYTAPTDTTSGLPVIGAGGQLSIPGSINFIPTPYRYSIIIERAKNLVSLAQQVESAFLSTLEKRDAEYYTLMKARQDVRTARAGVRLQDLRTKVAENEINLAELQRDRAQIQADHYKTLLNEGVSALEIANLGLLGAVSALQASAATLNFLAAALPSSVTAGFPPSVSFSPSGTVSSISAGLSNIAASLGTQASIIATLASYERRALEWEFQRSLALQDVKIGQQQVKISQNRLRVVAQERYIASLQSDHTEQTADFLANKFTNVELYDWMSGVLEEVYSFFLQQATSMSKLAVSQLAFERQEIPPPFIQDDYWEVSDDSFTGGDPDEPSPDRRGITGSARLLQDIFQLDQYAFETDQRKNQLVKNISLAHLAPAEFHQFKQSGVMNFATPMELFDRDFPGHYLRLIKRIRISVIALIPAIDGIKAALTTTGSTRVVVGGDVFQTININRGSETVAFSSARDASGLFELESQKAEKLFPFEGMGVDTQWEFKLPRAANRFDFKSIADVIITIEYTSLNSFTYRQQIIQEINNSISGDRPFSFRNEFADEWYDLNNPDLTDKPMTVEFDTREEDFPANIDNLKIQQIVLYFIRADNVNQEIQINHLKFNENDSFGTIGGGGGSIDGIISTRRGNASSWIPMIGKSPYGRWELSFPDSPEVRTLFTGEVIKDILFVITYRGITPEWQL